MNVEGVWRVEILGAYGWHPIGTAFMLDGRYLEAGDGHHAAGVYKLDDDKIDVAVKVTQHGKTRTIFGETEKHLEARIEGKLKKPGKITGRLHPPKKRDYELQLRMTQMEKLE